MNKFPVGRSDAARRGNLSRIRPQDQTKEVTHAR